MRAKSRGVGWLWLWLSAAWLAQPHAYAQDHARADELFVRGREQLAAGDYAAACPSLAESYRLDPATGSLLALALCHERAGQLASALHAYREAATRAASEGRADRERAAREKATALNAEVSTLQIDASAAREEPGFELRVNGQPLSPEQLSSTFPVDGGEARVEASATGKQPWQTTLTVASRGETRTLVIPALEPTPAPILAPAPPAPKLVVASAAPRVDSHTLTRTPAEWTGIALLSAGGAAFVTSLGLVLRAEHQENRADVYCTPTCTPEGEDARSAEERARSGALIGGLVGLGAAVVGMVSYVWGRQQRPRHARAALTPWPTRAGAGASVHVTF